jgi:hypothetical protein
VEIADARGLAVRLLASAEIRAVSLVDPHTVELTTVALDVTCAELPRLAASMGLSITRMVSPDADLESLYGYLVS